METKDQLIERILDEDRRKFAFDQNDYLVEVQLNTIEEQNELDR